MDLWKFVTAWISIQGVIYSTVYAEDCVITFSSDDAPNGTFTSPNFPNLYPRNTECNYLFFGKENEKIYIEFTSFDVEGIPPGCTEDTQSDYVEFSNYNANIKDRKMPRFCGQNYGGMMKNVRSDANFFRVTFKSNDVYDATGFKAFYQFRKDEDSFPTGIPPASSTSDDGFESGDCDITFSSEDAPTGKFTSPNFPNLYPRNTECNYLFYGKENEKVYIEFTSFDVEGIPPGCSEATQSDYVEFSNYNVGIEDRKMPRFCGKTDEGGTKTVNSDGNFFRVLFKSNDVYDATGFEAAYQFREQKTE